MKLLQNQEQKKFSSEEIRELKEVVKKRMEQEKIKFFPMIYTIASLIAAVLIIAMLALLIFVNLNSNIKIVVIVILIVAILALSFLVFKYLTVKSANERILDQFKEIRNQTFFDWFNKYYKDIEISNPISKHNIQAHYMDQISNLRINNEPFLNYSNIYPGYRFRTKKGIVIDTFIIKVWASFAPIPLNGSMEMFQQGAQRVEIPHFFAFIDNPDQKWNNFQFQVDYSRDNDNSLENATFNKYLGYRSNDPIRLRLLLTPWTQEQLVKDPNFKWTLTRDENSFIWYGKYLVSNNIFDFNRKIKPIKTQMIKLIVDDLVEDIEIVQRLLQHLSIYKSIIF